MAISRELIMEAAIRLINRHGVEQLSMRTLAEELQIKAASLYWHIQSKQELYALIAENLCAKLELTAEISRPKKYLFELMEKYRAQLLEQRDAVTIFLASPPDTPARVQLLKNIIYCLGRLGVKEQNCFTAANLLQHYVLTFVAEQTQLAALTPAELASRQKLLGAPLNSDFDEQFDYGLDVLFSGLWSV